MGLVIAGGGVANREGRREIKAKERWLGSWAEEGVETEV